MKIRLKFLYCLWTRMITLRGFPWERQKIFRISKLNRRLNTTLTWIWRGRCTWTTRNTRRIWGITTTNRRSSWSRKETNTRPTCWSTSTTWWSGSWRMICTCRNRSMTSLKKWTGPICKAFPAIKRISPPGCRITGSPRIWASRFRATSSKMSISKRL